MVGAISVTRSLLLKDKNSEAKLVIVSGVSKRNESKVCKSQKQVESDILVSFPLLGGGGVVRVS